MGNVDLKDEILVLELNWYVMGETLISWAAHYTN